MTDRKPTTADPAEHIDQTKRDRREAFVGKLTRRISEHGNWVYQSDLALLNQCHTMLCESEHERDLYRAYTIQLLSERPFHEVTGADIDWARSILNTEAVR